MIALLRHCTTLVRKPLKLLSLRAFSKERVVVSNEVSSALRERQPVVGLESTIITHGMPFPDNLGTAKDVENTIRSRGAVPATIGIYQGQLHVGMSNELMEALARIGPEATKVSRRDLPAALSKGLSGGTTVSATMVACNRVGIQVFVTGGIGGVHRGGESTLDISADLSELGRTPVAVVSAGVKSILDIGRTLEFLETEGVCVATFGESKDFPSFFTSRSGHNAPWRVADAHEAASLIASRNALHLDSGILIAVPIPQEYEADGTAIEEAIKIAYKEAEEGEISGNAVTPYILNRVNEITGGASLRSNVALLKNNAIVGSDIAVALADLDRKSQRVNYLKAMPMLGKLGQPVVIGGSVVDIVVGVADEKIQLNGQTHRGCIRTSFGGVGRNVADCMSRLGKRVRLVSAVGCDRYGDALLSHNPKMDVSGIEKIQHGGTATYCTMLDCNGNCVFGVGDMAIHDKIDVKQIQRNESHILSAPLVVLDGNLSTATISCVLEMCQHRNIPVWFEPTDVRKATKPFTTDAWRTLTGVSPNLAELREMHRFLSENNPEFQSSTPPEEEDPVQEGIRLGQDLVAYIPSVLVTLGPHGALLLERPGPGRSNSNLEILHCPVMKTAAVRSVSGAGDCLIGAHLCGLLEGMPKDRCLTAGLEAARRSLASLDAVPDTLAPNCLSSIALPLGLRRIALSS